MQFPEVMRVGQVKVTCLTCGTTMVTKRFFTAPARIRLTCIGCEAQVLVNLTQEDLAQDYANQIAETSLD